MATDRVVHFASIACIRFAKFASIDYILGNLGMCLVEQVGGADIALEVPSWSYWRRGHDLISSYIMNLKDCIWHIHGEPTGLAAVVRMGSDAPIVLNVHDARWGLGDEATPEEMSDLEAADFVIVPSLAYLNNLPIKKKESIVIRSGCIGGAMPDDYSVMRCGGVVYEGGIDLDGWRDYRELCEMFRYHGIGFHIMSHAANIDKIADEYRLAGVSSIEHHEYRNMIRMMQAYDWALIAPGKLPNKAYATSWPNKYAESLQAGLPVLVVGVDEVAVHAVSSGCGYSFASFDAMFDFLLEHPRPTDDMRRRAKKVANGLAMINYRDDIERVYRYAQKNAAKRVAGTKGG